MLFPQDPNETQDTDGDGTGDNADEYPTDPYESSDSDGDGVGDNADAFPNDPNESVDSDGDGTGDNSDAFPNDSTETADTDNDGVGDNADAFPNDASETTDSDGDGVGDNSDAFPNDSSETTDTDGDGIGDNTDYDPNDANVSTSPAYFIHGDDGINGNGYYYPVYTTTDGLSSYHSHTIQGVVVYMEDSDANHAQTSLPSNNTYAKVPNTTAPDSDGDGVEDWEDYFANDSNLNVTKAELDGYSLDTYRPVASNLYIKILNNWTTGSGLNLTQGDYHYSTGYSLASNSVKVTIDGFDHWLSQGRGTDWEIVSASSDIYNPPPTDTDGDGVSDSNDAFPNDPNETTDTDGDGTGDNADAFPNDSTETTDTDGDGEGDNSDPNPNDPNVTSATDSDGDGVNDSSDYFPDNSSYSQTKAELDAYSLDTYKSFAVGDIIKILINFTETAYNGTLTTNLIAGEYYIVTQTGNHWVRFVKDNNTYQLYDTPRGTKWEVVNPSNNLTPNPNTGLSSYSLDTYFDTSVTDPTGKHIRILTDFTSIGTNFTSGDHYEIQGVDNTTTQDLEIDANGSTVVIYSNDRGTKWEIVSASADLESKPNTKNRASDAGDIVFLGTTYTDTRQNKFADITRHYYTEPNYDRIDIDLDFNNTTDYQKINFVHIGNQNGIDNNSNPDTKLFYTDPELVYNFVCVANGANPNGSGSYADLKYAGSKNLDALPSSEGGTTEQDTRSTEFTNNLQDILRNGDNDKDVIDGNSTTSGFDLVLYIDGVKEPSSEFLSYNMNTSGVIQIITSSSRIQAGDYVHLLKVYSSETAPELLKETYSPRTFFYDAVQKVYHNNTVTDLISVDQNAYTIGLDTTNDGSADTTLDIEWGRKYDHYTKQDTAIYDVTPPQVFRQKVTSIYNGSGYTSFKTWNIDRGDYTIGASNAENADSLRVTKNLQNLVNGVDNDVAVLSAGSGGNGKTAYFSHNGTPLNIYGVDNTGAIYIRVNTSNSTLLSVGDIVEMYIA